MKKNNYCECRIPSPSAHHRNCLNDGCGKRIKEIDEEIEQFIKDFKEREGLE